MKLLSLAVAWEFIKRYWPTLLAVVLVAGVLLWRASK